MSEPSKLTNVIIYHECDDSKMIKFKIYSRYLFVLTGIFNNAQVKTDNYLYSYVFDEVNKPFVFNTRDLKIEYRFILSSYFDTDLLNAIKEQIKLLIKIHKKHVTEQINKSHQFRDNMIFVHPSAEDFVYCSLPVFYANSTQLRLFLAHLANKYSISSKIVYELFKKGIKTKHLEISLDDLDLTAIKHYQSIQDISEQFLPVFSDFAKKHNLSC